MDTPIILSDKIIQTFSYIFSWENIALFGFQESLDRSHGFKRKRKRKNLTAGKREAFIPLLL